ncbi:low-density lipoprotein receptor-related protein 4-like isoform X2 [Haliotis rubra]|uniref:low-density lipoprotein receptor-related protein 4-like isoform X2 n=1 Tax=Haliotis rubra TaxID=36100 RepID=UPI001EE5FBD4|nr:low-density lipoprotein receptor-related protein 4-like isoform X2 [Haliotis rubra]
MASVNPLCVLLGVLTTVASSKESPKLVILLSDLGRDLQPASIHTIHLHHLNLSTITSPHLISPMAIDFDKVGEHIYWTDITMKQVRRADTDGGQTQVISQRHTTSSPVGLTVDSIARQLFYTDDGEDIIVSVHLNTLVSTTIIDSGLDKPRGIAADTRDRRLYWVDRGSTSKIETSDYMGDQRKTLVSSDLHFPYDITLDENTGRLYWADTAGYIGSVLVDGSDMKKVLTQSGTKFFFISYFNGLLYYTVFQNDTINIISTDGIYWAPLKASTIQSCAGIHVYSPNYNNSAPCTDGHYGHKCEPCGHCAYICEKTTGLCYGGCSPGYKGDNCTQVCPPGSYGDDCAAACSNCNNGSVCNPVTGQCPDGCLRGWRGANCDIECPSNTYGAACAACGVCAGGVSCDNVSGLCDAGCDTGWTGEKCDTEIDGTTAENQTFNHNADGIPRTGTLIGIATAGILFIVVVAAVALCVLTKRRKRRGTANVDTDALYRDRKQPVTMGDNNRMSNKGVSSVHILSQDVI